MIHIDLSKNNKGTIKGDITTLTAEFLVLIANMRTQYGRGKQADEAFDNLFEDGKKIYQKMIMAEKEPLN
ncbi:hypothetical protein [Peptostreptococcus faecalis]|uniref:hypothetical protein n=1 Tax=Peptostreptococcus faecalis TaxID=2045015 RepID=UPI000C7BFAD4|nr:hypothetical protein [Peptostreptococcus faecalis]